MTVSDIDEILASGRYVDRRGRVWTRMHFWTGTRGFEFEEYWTRFPYRRSVTPTQMRRFIRMDQHRAECPGLYLCIRHPVPYVTVHAHDGYLIWEPCCPVSFDYRRTLPEAISAAIDIAKPFTRPDDV